MYNTKSYQSFKKEIKDEFTKIKEDTKYKSEILHSLGLNVNLAPVVDVSTNSNDYIYERNNVSKEDIVEFANNIKLDTIYFLTNDNLSKGE